MIALCDSQIQGIIYSGLEIFLNKYFMPRIASTTAQDIMSKIGIEMLDLCRTKRDSVLINGGHTPETGDTFDKDEMMSKIENLSPEADAKDVLPIIQIQAYNNRSDKRPHIDLWEAWLKVTTLTKRDIAIELDEIHSKKQKETRSYLIYTE